MHFQKYFIGFWLCIVSTLCFSHVAGVTDTGIHVRTQGIDLVYTLPIDNINEFTDIEKNDIDNTIIDGIVVSNIIDQKTTFCQGRVTSKKILQNIQSEQFNIRYTCNSTLDILSISYSLFLPEYENHKNHVRLSIAGRSQSFTLSNNKKSHTVSVKKLLSQWNKASKEHRQKINSTQPEDDSQISQASTGFAEILWQSRHYFLIGAEHILLGYDHVLFLIGLLLLPLGLRPMIAIATSFTLAHSITLGVSVLEIFSLPAPYVEAVIALSIVYIAIENLRVLKGKLLNYSPSSEKIKTPWRQRTLITFLFGLLHGFGFSYVLKEIGLGEHIVGSLLFFNLGVEFGQLLIIALIFPLLWYAFHKKWGLKLAVILSACVGLMGLFWLMERIYSLT